MYKIFFKYNLFLTLLVITNIYPQNTEITVTGFVTDYTSGEELPYVSILLYKDSLNFSSAPIRGAITKNHGFFALPKLNAGTFYIVARSIGYKTFIREIKLTAANFSQRFNIALQQEDMQLPELTVKGNKENDQSLSKFDISYELLKKLPTMSGELDVFKSLQLLPGIKTESEMSAGLYVRGGSPDQNLTLVDDAILYNPSHLGNFSTSFNSYAIQNIRLIKGAFPAEYGGRLSSVLDIKLRSGTKEKSKGIIGLGLINSFFALEGPVSENSTYMISGRKMYYDLYQNNFNKSSISPRYNFADINGKVNYNISESDIFSFSGVYSGDNLTNPSNVNDILYDIEWSNTSFSFNWLKINSNSLFINNSISYVNFKTKSILQDETAYSTASDYYANSNLRDLFVKSNVELFWRKDNVFKTGIELALHNYDLIYSEKYNPLLETDEGAGNNITSTEAAFFFQNEWEISSRLKTNLGGRFYYFRSKKYLEFEPRLSVSYYLNEYINFSAAFSTAHQFLHLITRNDISLPTDLWYPSGSIIEPCKSDQYSLSANSKLFNNMFLFSVEGYYKDMKNLYEFNPAQKYTIGEDIAGLLTKGDGEAYGVEFFLNKLQGNFTGWIGYTLSWTKRVFSDINLGRVFYPRYDRRHDFSTVLAYSFSDNFKINLTWEYASGQYYSVPTSQYKFPAIAPASGSGIQVYYSERNSYKLADYHKMDIGMSYDLNWGIVPFEIYLTCYNVYNRHNPFAAYINFNSSGSDNTNNLSDLKLKQITLFPFTPTIGFIVKF